MKGVIRPIKSNVGGCILYILKRKSFGESNTDTWQFFKKKNQLNFLPNPRILLSVHGSYNIRFNNRFCFLAKKLFFFKRSNKKNCLYLLHHKQKYPFVYFLHTFPIMFSNLCY